MEQQNEKLESYLEEFKPRAVRGLELSQRARSFWQRRLAAAAVVLATIGGTLWYLQHEKKMSQIEVKKGEVQIELPMAEPELNSIALTKLALENPNEFEKRLQSESRRVLPNLWGEQSTLSVLTKD